MSAYTKGPWFVQHGWLTVYTTDNPGSGTGKTIAIASPLNGNGDLTREQVEANARLIAAAPELLEACQWALNYIDTLIHPEAPKVCDALKSAIAKARGDA